MRKYLICTTTFFVLSATFLEMGAGYFSDKKKCSYRVNNKKKKKGMHDSELYSFMMTQLPSCSNIHLQHNEVLQRTKRTGVSLFPFFSSSLPFFFYYYYCYKDKNKMVVNAFMLQRKYPQLQVNDINKLIDQFR